jgi:L-iditol 2-dehydrogenase
MKQAVMTAPGQIELREIEQPKPQSGEVLIKIERIGVCGSDIHVYHGLHPYTSYPVVQGHEVSGIIAELGKDVSGFQIGDHVVFTPQVTCGTCYPCRHGMEHICDNLKVMGFQTDGAAQDYLPVSASEVLKVPDNISLDHAAMIEPLAVAVHALGRFGDVKGKTVVVLGAGTIGNLVAQTAQAFGASKVILTDVSSYKIDKAHSCGIPLAINTNQTTLADTISKEIGPDKADVILECVGVQDTITQAVDNARKGSTIVVVGVFGKKPVVDLGLVQDHELSLVGTLMYQKNDYKIAIQLVTQGKLNLDAMITHRFSFDQYLEAYEAIEQSKGNYLKVMIELD